HYDDDEESHRQNTGFFLASVEQVEIMRRNKSHQWTARGASSRPISTAGAAWVSLLVEMKSTPVSAIDLIVSILTPPEASSGSRPSTNFTASRISSSGMLSNIITSAL